MFKIKFYITILIARLAYFFIKVLNRTSGTSFIGMLALKLCPNFLKYCKSYVKKSIAITGTNGKTTTSGLLAHIIEESKCSVINNVKGANMLTGIANIFALNISFNKYFDYAVLESDEAYLTKLYDYFPTDNLVVTNLFRDQLDRYGEIEKTFEYIKDAVEKSSLNLLLNADDPLVARLGKGKNAKYFGFTSVTYVDVESQSNSPSEMFACSCGSELEYDKYFIAQEGHYFCKNCNFKRPEPDYEGNVKIYKNYFQLSVMDKLKNKQYDFEVHLVGLYNAYNALAAISQALDLGIEYRVIVNALSSYKSIFGRSETRLIKGHKTLIQLIKNPTGASEVLKTVDLSSHIIIAINDNYADGRDVSWLWDSDFEQLKNAQYPIITSGIRACDMAVRLKYAGVSDDNIIVCEDIKEAIEITLDLCSDKEENITIMPSYTALLKLSKMKF